VSDSVQCSLASKGFEGVAMGSQAFRPKQCAEKSATGPAAPREGLPGYNFLKDNSAAEKVEKKLTLQSYWDRDPDLWMYRRKTTALLRRYMQWSLEAGRLPSLLGQELFRAKRSVRVVVTFEDRVIFIHDVERCLERLANFDREIIARVVLQEHEQWQAAKLLHCTRKTIARRLPEVLDELSEALLKVRLLTPLPEVPTETL
jgi:hypothetical protein